MTNTVRRYSHTPIGTRRRKLASGECIEIPSLEDLCLAVMRENIDKIEYLGPYVSYEMFKPVMRQLPAEQLEKLECFNPHFHPESDELWKELVAGRWKAHADRLGSYESWKEKYISLHNDDESRLKSARSRLEDRMKEASNKRKTVMVEEIPRMVKRGRAGMVPGFGKVEVQKKALPPLMAKSLKMYKQRR